MSYGLKEYKALLEQNLRDLSNPMHIPFTMDPFTSEATAYRTAKMESINYALEMLPEIKEPMKDHEFREQVNLLRDLAINYSQTGHLRERMAVFLKEFKDKVGQ